MKISILLFSFAIVSPALSAGPLLVLDASRADQIVLAEGEVAAWRAGAFEARQADRGRRPVLRKNLNQRQTLYFDGNDFMDGPPILSEGDDTFTFVVLWRPHRQAVQAVFEQAGAGTGRRASLLQVKDKYGFNGQNNDAHSLVPTRPKQWHLTGLVITGSEQGNVRIADNDAALKVGRINMGVQNLGVKSTRIGGKVSGGELFQGDIAEIRIYDEALTDEALAAVMRDLATRWEVDFTAPPAEIADTPPPPPPPVTKPGPPADVDAVAFFEEKIRPILSEKCFRCHGEEAEKKNKLKGGLRVDHLLGLLKGGDSGPAILPGDADASMLVEAVRYKNEDTAMPPKGRLSDEQIANLGRWVEMGAPWPGVDPSTLAIGEDEVAYDWQKFRREHWSFKPVTKPEVPVVKNAAWVQGDLDRFVLAKLENKDLTPNPPADRYLLLRRAYLDLTGLPPSPARLRAFLDDDQPGAFARVVDELLASPHYGEHWGRHWLDVARYSDGLGGFGDGAALPNAWRYRDWVVQALNDDMAYDRFVRAQIAGDVLPGIEHMPEATGFFAVGPTYKGDGGDPEATAQAKAETLSDRVDTFSRGFLGLTAACARCHDHKFDPITIKDYYALAGVFNNTGLTLHPLCSKEELEAYKLAEAGVKKQEQAIKTWENDQREMAMRLRMRASHKYLVSLDAFHRQESETDLVVWATSRDLAPESLKRWDGILRNKDGEKKLTWLKAWWDRIPAGNPQAKSPAEIASAAAALQGIIDAGVTKLEQKEKLEKSENDLINNLRKQVYPVDIKKTLDPAGMAEWERQKTELAALIKSRPPKPPEAHGMSDRGKANMHVALRGDLRKKGPLVERRFLEILEADTSRHFTDGSGRLELARATTDPSNPLTARVMVNRIWLWHFGEALVRTPSNFGVLGETPSHPALLDWLAARFVEEGWSMKKLHREILLSATWQMSSRHDADKFAADGDNRLLWRMNPRKLGVEAWRDSLLAVTGELDRSLGGAPNTDMLNRTRRTLYGTISRNGDRFTSDDFLRLFDFPAPRASSAKRAVSTVPQQYLFMMNSPFMLARAKHLADDLAGIPEPEARIEAAYERLYARSPQPVERAIGLSFLGDDKAAWPQYVQVLLSAHEFLQIQ